MRAVQAASLDMAMVVPGQVDPQEAIIRAFSRFMVAVCSLAARIVTTWVARLECFLLISSRARSMDTVARHTRKYIISLL